MNVKLLALLCIILTISLPFVTSAEIVEEDYEEFDTGESIVVNVKSYEPTILTSNLIEDNDVPVYIYLAGSTLGTLLERFTGLESNIEPLYGGIEIEKVKVRPTNIETTDAIAGDVKYYRPNKLEPDTLGYLTFTLKQIDRSTMITCSSNAQCDSNSICDTGVCIPRQYNLSFSAEIWFDHAERLYSLSKTALILPENKDEEEWVDSLEQFGAMYSFFGGRGLIRVDDVGSNSADVTIYSNKDLYWPIIGAPRPIADLTLTKGQESDYVDLGFTDEIALRNAKFRLTLTAIKDPARERATLWVTVKGKQSQVIVTEGSPLYPGSTWTVESISIAETTRSGGMEHILVIKDKSENRETLVTRQNVVRGEEIDLLNYKFYNDANKRTLSSDQIKKGIFHTSGTATINAMPISQLSDWLGQYLRGDRGRLIIDGSEVSEDRTMTTKTTIEDGSSLKTVLARVLPSGYYFSVEGANRIALKKFESSDPCDNAEIYNPSGTPAIYTSPNSKQVLDLLCTAIHEYQQVIDNYDGQIDPTTEENLADKAYYQIGRAYEDLLLKHKSLTTEEEQGAKELQIKNWQELLDRNSKISEVQGNNFEDGITALQNALMGNVEYGSTSVEDNRQFVAIKLVSVEVLNEADLASVQISKDGITSTYHTRDTLFNQEITIGSDKYNWYVASITDGGVTFKKEYAQPASKSARSLTRHISLDRSDDIEGFKILVKSVDTKKEAYITVTPGSGEPLRSVSNFSVHIPIEARGLKLNPEKIGDKIEKAKKLQEKLENNIEKLNKIVTYWNYVCLGVFSYVTIKSSFFSSSSQARHDAIHGVDDQSGWNDYCIQASSGSYSQRAYKSYDECMQKNAGNIQKDIDAAQAAKQRVENMNGNYVGEPWYDTMVAGYAGTIEECQELVGPQVFLDEKSLQKYAYLQELNGTVSEKNLQPSVTTSVNSYTGQGGNVQHAREQACQEAVKAARSGADEREQRTIAAGVYESKFNEVAQTREFPVTKNWAALSKNEFGDSLVLVGKIFKGASSQRFKVFKADGKDVEVEELTLEIYESILNDLNSSSTFYPLTAAIKDNRTRIEGDLKRLHSGFTNLEKRKQITATDGSGYYITTKRGTTTASYTIYVGTPTFSTADLNENFAEDARIEIYGTGEWKGLPYCLPHTNGNFIKINSYTEINGIDDIQYWNVGPDGQLCSGDDILVQHESELLYETASPNYNTLVTFANRFVRMDFREGEAVPIGSRSFIASFGKSKKTADRATGSCYDVMNPGDCKMLFNVCDPVMCPPSRFNMGGRYNVDSVVESGMVGSLVLGSQTGDVLPICLTGILASLNYWNSMLEGYIECLETSKYEGKTVGICDKIRSVYWCETAVREVALIMGQGQGGLLDFLAGKVYGGKGGGGEYLKFKSSLQNTQDSVTFFTTEYATTAFAAFKGRSFEEVGTEFCRQAIYGKVPGFQDFMTQITTPEDPNQFYASLTTRPFAPTQGQEAYQTYYHIYAGVNENIPNIVYSVYLKNSITNEIKYVTEECDGVSSSLELGDMTDVTMDCIGPEGYDQVCVVINGETQCGFGTISSAFANDFLKDTLVNDEIRKDIDSEAECFPSGPTASPSLSSVATLGQSQNLLLPYQFGILETGVQRVCAVENPGAGQNSGDWTRVGTCGEDEDGRSLGLCWLNQDSYSIQDAKRSENANEYLEQLNFEESKANEGILVSQIWGPETTKAEYKDITDQLDTAKCDMVGKDISSYKNLPERYTQVIDYTFERDYAAAAQQQIGNTYFEILTDCNIEGRGTPKFKGVIYPAGSTKGVTVNLKDEVGVSPGTGTFEITISNLVSTDAVTEAVIVYPGRKDPMACGPESSGTWVCSVHIDVKKEEDIDITVVIKEEDGKGSTISAPAFKLTSKKTAAEQQITSSEDACGICTTDYLSGSTFGGCSESTCHTNGNDCYLDTSALNECEACFTIYTLEREKKLEVKGITQDDKEKVYNDMCNELSDDKQRCSTKLCHSKFLDDKGISGICKWDTPTSSCVYDELGTEDNIKAVAENEYTAWGNGRISEQDNCPTLEKYYTAASCYDPQCDPLGPSEPTPWSAAFVSYVMNLAGMNFPVACSHTTYFTEIRDASTISRCGTSPISDISSLEEGNVLCYCDPSNITACDTSVNTQYAKNVDVLEHCDIVTEVSGDNIIVIGGNVGDTVTRRRFNRQDILDDKYIDERFVGFISCLA
jgi:hypothetical protein